MFAQMDKVKKNSRAVNSQINLGQIKIFIVNVIFVVYFHSFSNKQYQFYNKLMGKMSIQYPAAPEFDLTTF